MPAHTITELRQLTDEELILEHDGMSHAFSEQVEWLRQEIARRDAYRQGEQMVHLTQVMMVMTIAITVATLVNVAAAIELLVRT